MQVKLKETCIESGGLELLDEIAVGIFECLKHILQHRSRSN
jgi:hypothetical protein